MFKSIRWTIQLWHASLLAVVLAGFGAASYYGISQMRYQEVDAELERAVQLIAAAHPPGPRGGPDRFDQFGPQDRRNEFPTTAPNDRPWDRQNFGGRGGRGGRPGGGGGGPPRNPDIEIPPALARRFESAEPDSLYYAVFNSENALIKTSPAAPASISPVPLGHNFGPPQPQPAQFRQRGDFREAFTYGPFDTHILVGRSIVRERAELGRLALLLGLIGAGVLVIGLAGGWLVAGRVVRPIGAISRTAEEISASNLSRRIDTAAAKSELGVLASVLNKMFARLEAAFAQQVRFTADASHELRTPLSIIHTHAQLSLSRQRTAEQYRETIATCLRASTRMKELVDSLLFLAGADAGKLSIHRQPCELGQIIQDCAAMMSPLAGEKKVTIETDVQEVKIDADATRIAQVITNLLTNAIRYNRENGTIRISLKSEGGDAIVSIADSGVGIPAEHQPHIFERFYRVDKARSRDAGGNGLGLAICRSIIDAHGGQISFTSQENVGTTFMVRLPQAHFESEAGPVSS